METTIMGLYGSFPKIRGPQYIPKYTRVLIIGTLKMVPPNLGKLPFYHGEMHFLGMGVLDGGDQARWGR